MISWGEYSATQHFNTTSQLVKAMLKVYVILQDPKVYVETILEVHHKYNALVLTAFNNDAGFVAALDKVSVSCFRCRNRLYALSSFCAFTLIQSSK